jgi:hypothetical protein
MYGPQRPDSRLASHKNITHPAETMTSVIEKVNPKELEERQFARRLRSAVIRGITKEVRRLRMNDQPIEPRDYPLGGKIKDDYRTGEPVPLIFLGGP